MGENFFANYNCTIILREWGVSESLRGVGAIALGYPASSDVKAAERKEDYIVRI